MASKGAIQSLVSFALNFITDRVGMNNRALLDLVKMVVPDIVEQFADIDKFDADARVAAMEWLDQRMRGMGL